MPDWDLPERAEPDEKWGFFWSGIVIGLFYPYVVPPMLEWVWGLWR